jgi:hypothetical protein
MRMSDGPGNTAPPPIQYGDIVFAEISDPNGLNPKVRRVVVLTPDAALAAGYPIVVAGITATLPDPLTPDYVVLPWKNPPGRHPKTGMAKRAAVLCTWLVRISSSDIQGHSGFVPPAYMMLVDFKTGIAAKAIGGWP